LYCRSADGGGGGGEKGNVINHVKRGENCPGELSGEFVKGAYVRIPNH